MLAMNEALVLGSLRQHELAETLKLLNVQLQKEVVERKQAEELLQRNHDTFFNLIENAPFGLYVLDAQFRLRQASSATRKVFSSVSPLIGRDFEEVVRSIWPDPFASEVLGRFRHTLETGEPYASPDITEQRLDIAEVESYDWKIERVTLPDGQYGVVCYFYEITERRRAEAALRESEERFRTLFELDPIAVYSCDASGIIQNFNRRAVELWGREPSLGEPGERFCGSLKMFRPDGSFMPDDQCPMAEVISGKITEARDAEVLVERPDGSLVTLAMNIRPLKNQHGKITGAINCFYDISERKKAEERRLLLTHELAHRGKNLLAVVLSITSRSLSGARPFAEERDALIQRLHALGRSQSVLINGAFEGAPLTEIIRLECESFSNRVRIAGPDIMLNTRVAQTFTLIVHELATNAAKYGALSGPAGRIAIDWSIEGAGADARFRFQWQEFDGPTVVPPTRQGFGRVVLEKAAAQEFGAAPKIRYAPEGLNYEIDAPLSVVAADSAREGSGKEQG